MRSFSGIAILILIVSFFFAYCLAELVFSAFKSWVVYLTTESVLLYLFLGKVFLHFVMFFFSLSFFALVPFWIFKMKLKWFIKHTTEVSPLMKNLWRTRAKNGNKINKNFTVAKKYYYFCGKIIFIQTRWIIVFHLILIWLLFIDRNTCTNIL